MWRVAVVFAFVSIFLSACAARATDPLVREAVENGLPLIVARQIDDALVNRGRSRRGYGSD